MTSLLYFVGQGTHKNTYKNTLKAKPYKAYGVLTKYPFRLTTSNKKSGFVMLRHARLALFKVDGIQAKSSVK